MKKQPKKKRRPEKWRPPSPDLVFDAMDAEDSRLLKPSETAGFVTDSDHAEEHPYLNMTVWQLRSKALDGDDVALFLLRHRAYEAVEALNSIAWEKPELLRASAATLGTWPVLHSRSPVVGKRNEEFFDQIHLGSEVAKFGIDAAVVLTTDTPQKKWALYLFTAIFSLRNAYPHIRAMMRVGQPLRRAAQLSERQWLSLHLFWMNDVLAMNAEWWPLPHLKYTLNLVEKCVGLPALVNDDAVTQQWWSLARELLMLNTDGNPQSVPELHEVGKGAAKHPTVTHDYVTNRPKRVRELVHSKILTDLKEEFSLIPRAILKAKPSETVAGENTSLDWIKELENEVDRIEKSMLDAETNARHEVVEVIERFRVVHKEAVALSDKIKKTESQSALREALKQSRIYLVEMISLIEMLRKYRFSNGSP